MEDLVDDHDDVTEPYDPNTYRLTPLLYSPPQKRRDDHETKGIQKNLFEILPKLNSNENQKNVYIRLSMNILESYFKKNFKNYETKISSKSFS